MVVEVPIDVEALNRKKKNWYILNAFNQAFFVVFYHQKFKATNILK